MRNQARTGEISGILDLFYVLSENQVHILARPNKNCIAYMEIERQTALRKMRFSVSIFFVVSQFPEDKRKDATMVKIFYLNIGF